MLLELLCSRLNMIGYILVDINSSLSNLGYNRFGVFGLWRGKMIPKKQSANDTFHDSRQIIDSIFGLHKLLEKI